jgi:predicted transcriptional regulator
VKYRSNTEIIDSILRSIRAGATKSGIMSKAYTSYAQLRVYLKLLLERQLISYEETTQLYHITERGLRFMNAYDTIKSIVPGVAEKKLANSLLEQPREVMVFEY